MDLKPNAMLVKSSFLSAYPGVYDKLDSTIKNIMGEDAPKKLRQRLKNEIGNMLNDQLHDRESASLFLDEVKSRADGHIPSPILETILAVSYMTFPEEEVFDGYYQEYSTSGHPKALGLNIDLRLPISWMANEGLRPHIVQKWRNLVGHGPANIMLLVYDLGDTVSQQEVDAFLEAEDFSSFLPEEGEFIDSSQVTIDGRPAAKIDYILQQDMGPSTVVLRVRQYQLFFDRFGVLLECQAGAGTGTGPTAHESVSAARESANSDFSANKNVCLQVANSIVIQDAWK